MSYSVYLPNYSIGENCYKELPYVARNYGKKAVVIGGKTAMEKAKDALLEGIKGSDLEITDFIWYGGDSSYENGNALVSGRPPGWLLLSPGPVGKLCCQYSFRKALLDK